MDVEQQIDKVAVAFTHIENAADQAGLAIKLFGRGVPPT